MGYCIAPQWWMTLAQIQMPSNSTGPTGKADRTRCTDLNNSLRNKTRGSSSDRRLESWFRNPSRSEPELVMGSGMMLAMVQSDVNFHPGIQDGRQMALNGLWMWTVRLDVCNESVAYRDRAKIRPIFSHVCYFHGRN